MKGISAEHFLAGVIFVLFILSPLSGLSFDAMVTSEFSARQGSPYCLGCHDGVMTAPIHPSHPVDTDYLLAQQKSKGKLKPRSQLDSSIQLQDGQVVCTSCHHPESQHEAKLAVNNLGSKLCLSCHAL